MAEPNQEFRIETISWDGQYGNRLTNEMRKIGKDLATCHVHGVSKLKNLIHKKKILYHLSDLMGER